MLVRSRNAITLAIAPVSIDTLDFIVSLACGAWMIWRDIDIVERKGKLLLMRSSLRKKVVRLGWIALEAKGIQYQYIEVDPYKKPQSLLEVNPRGLVPAIRHGDWGCGESTVLMEYIEDLQTGPPLFPQDARAKAHSRLWADHMDRKIVPTFYALLQSQNYEKQEELTAKLRDEISQIVDVCDPQGPFFLGPTLTYTDVHFAPWILRCRRVLKHYRDWQDPQPGSRWAIWFDAIENNEFVKATTSADELYIDSYERYAMNRPGTSELADAVNGGFNLP